MRHLAAANRRAVQLVAQAHQQRLVELEPADVGLDLDQHQQDEEENDEENIVIDMADEDDEDDDHDDDHDHQFAHDHPDGQLKSASKSIHEETITLCNNNNNDHNTDPYLKAQAGDRPQLGDAIWFDPNQCGYCIPGKVVDFYPDVNVLTVEGYSQVPSLANCATANDNQEQLAKHNKLLVEADEQLQIYELSDRQQLESDIKLRVPITHAQGHADLLDLAELTNESIIWNLKLRYKQELVYTRCGSKVLLSINPFKSVNQLYNLDQVNKYDAFLTSNVTQLRLQPLGDPSFASNENGAHWLSSELEHARLIRWLLLRDASPFACKQSVVANKSISSPLEPHLFEIANQALEELLVTGRDECFILLGESGSGKTEVCKLLVQYLATINKSPSNLVQEQILESIQVLESFGNAKTALNDNSSRFGRLLEIHFDLANGYIQSAQTSDLNLLDRSRIVSQIENERNYHIFYEFLAGLSRQEKEKYGLQSAEKYFYLNQGHCVELPGKEDGDDFRSLLSSMQVLGFDQDEQDTVFRLLASILHLGNVYFHRKLLAIRTGKLAKQQQQRLVGDQTSQQQQSVGVEGVEIGSDTEVRWVSHLLQIQFDSMMRCLTVRTTEAHQAGAAAAQPSDRIVTPLNIDQALDTRDAIARTLYTCLFKWLLQRINSMIQTTRQPSEHDHERDRCDSSSQAIYLCRTSESLCEFQPDKLSTSLAGDSRYSSMSRRNRSHNDSCRSIESACLSIIDAFGFENLHENNFEQLCINFTAEMLNYHTQRHLVKLEQAEYQRERLTWTPINSANSRGAPSTYQAAATTQSSIGGSTMGSGGNTAAIVNLLSKKPLGILAILDDECNFPKATDQSFVEKCHHNHALNENYQRARLSSSCHEFGIRHFKQTSRLVWYQVEGFIEKNRDSLRADIMELLLSSKMSIVSDMLRKLHPHEASIIGQQQQQQQQQKTLSRTHDGRLVTMKPRATSIAARFQDTLSNNRCLESLSCASCMDASLERPIANPWFILCLRPNRSKSPGIFDVLYIQEQVRSMQILDLVQIRNSGYPIKYRYADFLRRYRCLAVSQKFLDSQQPIYQRASEKRKTIRDVCRSIIDFRLLMCDTSFLSHSRLDSESESTRWYQCGLTKMFLHERLHAQLERQRLEEYFKAISTIQRQMRMWPIRHRFLLIRQAATVIQAHVRGHLARRNYWRTLRLVVLLQRAVRKYLSTKRQLAALARREQRRQLQLRQLMDIQAKLKSNQLRHRVANPNANQAQYRPQLDIPENLAQLYRAQRDQKPVHELSHLIEVDLDELWKFERRLRSTRGKTSPAGCPVVVNAQELLKDERQSPGAKDEDSEDEDAKFPLGNLILTYFSDESPSFGYSRLPITRPFSWSQICRKRRSALKRVPRAQDAQVVAYFSNLIQESTIIHKLLLRYIDSNLGPDNEVKTDRLNKFKLIVDYVIYLCLQKSLLRDELFLQLLSLSWNNPRRKSKENVWKLMINCLCCFQPRERALISYIRQFAHFDCPEIYKKPVLLKLTEISSIPSGSLYQRMFPPSLLEYWANQKSVCKLGLTASFYMDDYDFNQERSSGLSKSLVELGSRTSAQQVAAAVLKARHVPTQNLIGWSLEVEHVESAPPPPQSGQAQACRLRGDDLVLDQISRLELFPEFISLLERESISSEDTTRANLHASSSLRRNPSDLGMSPSRARYSSDMDLARSNNRLSQTSRLNRRYLATQLATTGDGSYATPLAFQHHQMRRAEHQNHLDQEGYRSGYHDARKQSMNLHRRSLSMQELQLASSSALNGRYFIQPQSHQMISPRTDTSESSHYASSYVHHNFQERYPNRNSASSLQQLAGNTHGQYQGGANQPRRRSQTPNSLQMQRFSSSAYGTGSSAYLAHERQRPVDPSQVPLSPPARSMPRRRLSARLTMDRSASNQYGSLSRLRPPSQSRRASSSSVISSPRSQYHQTVDAVQAKPSHQQLHPHRKQQSESNRPDQVDTGPHYMASSAMSDTSDAISLASHVRRVKVPQSGGDLDRYLDDLFQPMLAEADLDDMSDARSLAASIQGHLQLNDQLGAMGDPVALSKLIRGTTSPGSASLGENSAAENEEPSCRPTLSPTFETLLDSLKDPSHSQPADETLALSATVSLTGTSSLDQLGKMNFDELKALNKELENQIHAAQSNRPALSPINYQPAAGASVEEGTTVCDDIYSSRAKTIRIGKWRWPPSAEEEAAYQDCQATETDLQQPVPLAEELPVVESSAASHYASPGLNPGKLKISSEMKLKLEQLTTGSSSSGTSAQTAPAAPAPGPARPATGAVLQAKSSLDAHREQQQQQQHRVKKLSDNRRNLLENQLSGSGRDSQSTKPMSPGSGESISGGKVMAAKQQLAAAAGVALDALDAASQAGSRRQSAQMSCKTSGELPIEQNSEQRRSRILQDELGPQSKMAISQRLAFYQQSSQTDSSNAAAEATLDANKPTLPDVNSAAKVSQQDAQVYGLSIAKSLAQRQQEALKGEQAQLVESQNQWVSSSPDQSLGRGKSVAQGAREQSCRILTNSSDKKAKVATCFDKEEQGERKRGEICYLYGGVDWQVKIRKEFFLPSETYDDPLVVQLIFAQLVSDVFNPRHWTRLSNKERATLKALMKDNSIGYVPSLPPIGQLQEVKRELVRMARTFGLYFTRPYAARNFVRSYSDEAESTSLERAWIYGHSEDEGERTNLSGNESSSDESSQVNHELASARYGYSRANKLAGRLQRADNLGSEWIDLVAVHHSGLRLVSLLAGGGGGGQRPATGGRGAAGGPASSHKVLETLKYRDMTDVAMVGPSELLVSMRNGRKCWILSSFEARQLCSLLSYFHADYNKHLLANSAGAASAPSDQLNLLDPVSAGAKRGATSGFQGDPENIPRQSLLRTSKATKARARLAEEKKDAILASDDDHHGDHFQQRQTPDRLKQLNQTLDPHNDLAHSERVLPSYPSNPAKTPRSGARSGHEPAINHRPAPADEPAAPEQPAALGTESGRQSGQQAKPAGGQVKGASQPSRASPGSAKRARANKSVAASKENHQSAPKIRNIWQNSLSRMSNKFSLFGGSQSRASGSSKSQQASQQQASDQLHLDGWIESTTEFDNHPEHPIEAQLGQDSLIHADSLGRAQVSNELELATGADLADAAAYNPTSDQQVAPEKSEDGKYSLLQFALYNFREAIDKYSLESCANKQMDVGDTSTLRGSLKLIETLRGSGKAAAGDQISSSDGSSAASKHRGRRNTSEWTWRELAEMVKYTPNPIKLSLLRLPSDDLNRRAVECFQAIMSYMGDLDHQAKSSHSPPSSMSEVECVYLILMNCHNYPIMRDEVYCQLMKQTTNNRSTSNPDSCLRGWRLFSIVAAYFDCSDQFKPYLLKYLETAAYDKRRAYCSVALLCLQNLRKTFKYLGRKNVPSIEEIAATSAGRNSKRQIYRLPGGTERVINTKSTTVVEDIIHEICSNMLSISDPDEMLEFSLYCIADGDLYTMPLNRDEYILDITTELIKNHQQYFLIFCRSIWHFPLRLESKLYIEVIFNQIAPDYLEGLLLVLPGLSASRRRHDAFQSGSVQPLRLKSKLVKDIARIAALLHRASGTDYMPHKDEIKYLLPKPIITAMKQQQRSQTGTMLSADQIGSSSGSCSSAGSINGTASSDRPTLKSNCSKQAATNLDTVVTSAQKWIELVQSNWREMSAFDTLDAKAQFLDIIRNWPLFGSSFFAIKLIQRDLIHPTDYILALNKFGIQMLDTLSHESIHKYPFNEVISTRKVRSEDGSLYLDLKCGNLMKRTIIRIQTDQAHEISRLTRQYIDIEILQQQKLQHQPGRQQSRLSNDQDAPDSSAACSISDE